MIGDEREHAEIDACLPASEIADRKPHQTRLVPLAHIVRPPYHRPA